MNLAQLSSLKIWFKDYVADFYTGNDDDDRNIRLKEEHTHRVCRNITDLVNSLGLPSEDACLAEAIALFHDIGRFMQYRKYRTFFDRISENHARLGIRELARARALSCLESQDRRILTRAVSFHNAATLPDNEAERVLLFMKLIRDADKLDIWRVVTDYYREKDIRPNETIELGLPDPPECSEAVIRSVLNHRFASVNDIKTLNDFKLLQISWVFDLNFRKSFLLLKERRYIDAIHDTLPDLPSIRRAVNHAVHYLDAGCAGFSSQTSDDNGAYGRQTEGG